MAEFPTKSVGEVVTAADWNQIEDYAVGLLGYDETTANTILGDTESGALVSVTVTVPSSRKVFVESFMRAFGTDRVFEFLIRQAGSTVSRSALHTLSSTGVEDGLSTTFGRLVTVPSGSTTFTTTGRRLVGAGSVGTVASASAALWLRCYDCGPA